MGSEPLPKYKITPTRKPRKRKLPEPARAIEPTKRAVELVRVSLFNLEQALKELIDDGREEDAHYLQSTVNDLRFRHLVRLKQVACTGCKGYRGDVQIGAPCRCVQTEGTK